MTERDKAMYVCLLYIRARTAHRLYVPRHGYMLIPWRPPGPAIACAVISLYDAATDGMQTIYYDTSVSMKRD